MFVVLREMERGSEVTVCHRESALWVSSPSCYNLTLTLNPTADQDTHRVKQPFIHFSPHSVERDNEEVHRMSVFIDVLTGCMKAATHQFSL